jgi:hypothetical protein
VDVAQLFRGQEKRQDTFTITNEQQLNLDAGLGVGNALTIPADQLVFCDTPVKSWREFKVNV